MEQTELRRRTKVSKKKKKRREGKEQEVEGVPSDPDRGGTRGGSLVGMVIETVRSRLFRENVKS